MAAIVRLIWVLLLLAACTTPETFSAPTWTRQAVPTLARLDTVYGGAGWSGGFVVAGTHTKPFAPGTPEYDKERVPVLFTSGDGVTWNEVTASLPEFVFGGAAAGHGDRAFVLGNSVSGPVLLSSDGWKPVPLPGAGADDHAVSVGAGARGVVVAAFTKVEGVRFWHSPDGRDFGDPVTVPIADLARSIEPHVVATGRGFLLYGGIRPTTPVLLESEDGRAWTDIGAQLPDPDGDLAIQEVDAVQHNGSVTVVFANPAIPDHPQGNSPGLTGWYRRDGDTRWTTIADIGNGRLPDTAVVPNWERHMYEVLPWQGGFLAIGRSGNANALWTSPDAVKWDRMPVRDNGFDVDNYLVPIRGGEKVLLVQVESDDQVWVSGRTR